MENDRYWNEYYAGVSETSPPDVPSQFAAFLLTELRGKTTKIVDFGCGNGRDSLFFARHGYSVIGVDASEAAIDFCRKKCVPNSEFVCASVDEEGLAEKLASQVGVMQDGVTVYARFFVHAIDEATQAAFLSLCRELIGSTGRVALEFRTDRDQNQNKVTPEHYRRFVSPVRFMHCAATAGFNVDYFVEGFGFAKFRNDDAHVARFILGPG